MLQSKRDRRHLRVLTCIMLAGIGVLLIVLIFGPSGPPLLVTALAGLGFSLVGGCVIAAHLRFGRAGSLPGSDSEVRQLRFWLAVADVVFYPGVGLAFVGLLLLRFTLGVSGVVAWDPIAGAISVGGSMIAAGVALRIRTEARIRAFHDDHVKRDVG